MIPSANSALTERLFTRDLKVNAVGNVFGSRVEKTTREKYEEYQQSPSRQKV